MSDAVTLLREIAAASANDWRDADWRSEWTPRLMDLAATLAKITPAMIASARGATRFSQADRTADQFEHLESAAEVLETLMGKPR